jgi:hypothetical protein
MRARDMGARRIKTLHRPRVGLTTLAPQFELKHSQIVIVMAIAVNPSGAQIARISP